MTRLSPEEFEAACDEEFPVAMEKEAKRARDSEERLIGTLRKVQAWLGHPDFPAGVFAVEAAISRAIDKAEGRL